MGESWFYEAFGLRLKSDRAIPGLVAQPEPAAVDLEVCQEGLAGWWSRLLEMPQELWHFGFTDENRGEPGYRMWLVAGGEYYRLRYRDGCQFVMNRACTRLWVSGPEGATPEYLATYLLGPVLGILLRLRGTPCLHGSAVAVGAQALGLLGPPGAGKSTTAAAFACLGYPVLTDDIIALKEEGGEYLAFPGNPRLCLWPRSVGLLFNSPEALPLLIPENSLEPDWDKRCLDLTAPGYHYQSQPLPLKALYFLGERRGDGNPPVTAVTGQKALLNLMANAYGSNILDPPRRAQEFEVLGRLLTKIRLRRVTPCPGADHLRSLCETILSDFHSLTAEIPAREDA
ncbi:MAG: hypothetical protein ACHQ2F_00455 [Desulfobaccales bacterium]